MQTTAHEIGHLLVCQVELPEEETRHLFLFFREALHNIMRHAKATKVEIRVEKLAGQFRLTISDNA